MLRAIKLLTRRTHSTLKSHQRFEPLVLLQPGDYDEFNDSVVKDVMDRWTSNAKLVEHAFLIVILTRLVVLEMFHVAWKESVTACATSIRKPKPKPISEGEAKRIWAIFQLYPTLPGGVRDSFEYVMSQFLYAHPESLRKGVRLRLGALKDKGLRIRRILLDDLEAIAAKWPGAFGLCQEDSSVLPDNAAVLHGISRTLLTPVLRCFESVFPDTPLVLAGTKATEDFVNAVFTSASESDEDSQTPPPDPAALSTVVRTVTDLGGRFSESRLRTILGNVFGYGGFIKSLSPSLYRDIFYWLPGR